MLFHVCYKLTKAQGDYINLLQTHGVYPICKNLQTKITIFLPSAWICVESRESHGMTKMNPSQQGFVIFSLSNINCLFHCSAQSSVLKIMSDLIT